ncbi:PIN domain-containing protein [Candidatus Micrarchaeota archaeon]|nr:PIN domain-containing protein [Candidatus Micrarchaeota archaeon]
MEFVLDSHAWLEYFAGNQKYRDYIEGPEVLPFTVSITLTEVIRSLLRKSKTAREIEAAVGFISSKSIILPVEKENAVAAGFIAEKEGLHFSDALIYSFANPERKVVTGDPHFRKLPNAEFVA